MSLLLHGSEDEKLEWTFQLYDLDGDGFISKDEMEDVAVSVRAISFLRCHGSYNEKHYEDLN